jgi:fatty acid-binding protein DegV
MHADAASQAGEVAADLSARLGLSEAPIYDLPPAIVVHGGPGILGVSFLA